LDQDFLTFLLPLPTRFFLLWLSALSPQARRRLNLGPVLLEDNGLLSRNAKAQG